jgi:hypothetical protein
MGALLSRPQPVQIHDGAGVRGRRWRSGADRRLPERREATTLGLLFLAGLKGCQVVAGNAVALSLPAVYCRVAVFPIMGFSFSWRSNGGEFARVALVPRNTALSLECDGDFRREPRSASRALAGSDPGPVCDRGLPGLALLWVQAIRGDRLSAQSFARSATF